MLAEVAFIDEVVHEGAVEVPESSVEKILGGRDHKEGTYTRGQARGHP